jgi:hypothetical protein
MVMVPTPARAPLEPRFVQIAEGITALVQERPTVLPASLEGLLAGMQVVERLAVRVLGFSRACADTDHRLVRWVTGRYAARDLRLRMCADCGVVEVRDLSFDRLPGLSTGGRMPLRRDDLIGWYSGRRVAARMYF